MELELFQNFSLFIISCAREDQVCCSFLPLTLLTQIILPTSYLPLEGFEVAYTCLELDMHDPRLAPGRMSRADVQQDEFASIHYLRRLRVHMTHEVDPQLYAGIVHGLFPRLNIDQCDVDYHHPQIGIGDVGMWDTVRDMQRQQAKGLILKRWKEEQDDLDLPRNVPENTE